MGNYKKCLAIALVIAAIIAIITMYYTKNQEYSVLMFFGISIAIMIYFFSNSCSQCGNLAAIIFNNTELVDTNERESHFIKQKAVGKSVRRDYDGNVIDETTHYRDVNYVKTTTIDTYEDIFVCKYCGAMSKKRYKKRSYKSRRE
ncbi:hypothetical protein [Methanoregula sp.]|jgi:hypothetical protein|uniref:hypothetical protein n=1 Tax=Methanoregula sp. TaxID=2052170 RepID=UPI0035613B95